jgi:hypothetical protein
VAQPAAIPAIKTQTRLRTTKPGVWLLGFGISIVLMLLWVQRDRVLTGRNDFIQLWVSAKLVGTPQLYDFEVNRRIQIETLAATMENVVPSRPPFYAVLLKPLSWLPYTTAFLLFQIVSVACLCGFVWLNRARAPEIGLFCCFSLPVIATLANGQDLAIVIFVLTCAQLKFEKREDSVGGLLLSLCAIKFHLLLLVPLVPLIHRRWRVLAGGAAGTAAFVALSYLGQGRHWVSEYLAVLRNPILNPGADIMPNLHGAFATLGGSRNLELAACCAVAVLVAWLAWRARDFEVAFAYALIGSLLVSFHAYVHDALLLLPVLVILLTKAAPKAVRHIMLISVLPPVHLLLLAGTPYSIACPLLMLAILTAAGYSSVFNAPREQTTRFSAS